MLEDFVNNYDNFAKQWLWHECQEQKALNELRFCRPEFFQVLHQQFLNSVPAGVRQDPAWDKRDPIIHEWQPEDFIAHFTGCSNSIRIRLMKLMQMTLITT